MTTKVTTIAQEMCSIKESFEKIYELMDEEQEAVEAFGLYDNLMRKLGEVFATAIVSSLK